MTHSPHTGVRQHPFNLLLAVLILSLAAGPAAVAADAAKAPETTDAAPLLKQLDALAKPLIETGTIENMAVGLVRGDVQVTRGYGQLAPTNKNAPDQDTVYEIGSVSKVFTAVLLADMVQRGLVKLDEPVQDLLPAGVTVPRQGERQITLADLSTHTSGLLRMPTNFNPANPENPYADYTPKLMYAYLANAKLQSDIGTKYAYSNLGVGLLGHALALKAGMPYEKLMQSRIARPLGMTSTSVTLSPSQRRRLAPGWHDAQGKPTHNWDIPTLAGAGGIRSTVRDMLKFAVAHLHPDDSTLGKAMLMTHQPRHPLEGIPGMIGLGWHIAADKSTLWHNGQTGGYHSYVAVNRKYNVAVVVLTNTASGVVDAFGEQLVRMLAGSPQNPLNLRKAVKLDAKVLDRYVGQYQLAPGFVISVRRQGDGLVAQATGQPALPIYAESQTQFFYRVVDAQITFEVKDGKTVRLVLHQNGRDIPGDRLK